jgi:hypothetical protein
MNDYKKLMIGFLTALLVIIPIAGNTQEYTEVTQVFKVGPAYDGLKGTWYLRLPQGFRYCSYTTQRESANPDQDSFYITPVIDGININFDVPYLGCKGFCPSGRGERSWLHLQVTVRGVKGGDC